MCDGGTIGEADCLTDEMVSDKRDQLIAELRDRLELQAAHLRIWDRLADRLISETAQLVEVDTNARAGDRVAIAYWLRSTIAACRGAIERTTDARTVWS